MLILIIIKQAYSMKAHNPYYFYHIMLIQSIQRQYYNWLEKSQLCQFKNQECFTSFFVLNG